MKKIQNAKILTNQQMKHISGGLKWQSGHGIHGGMGGGACPANASKDDCKGECDLGVGKKKGACQIYRLAGNDYCACVE